MGNVFKPVHWVGSSRKDLRTFPTAVRRSIGQALYAAQRGEDDPSMKPLKGFGSVLPEEVDQGHQNAEEGHGPDQAAAGGCEKTLWRKAELTMARTSKPKVEEGSGNVFADLGLLNPEQERLKAHLTLEIYNILKERGLRQSEAAKLLGTSQPRVSELMRGRSGTFSASRLMEFLTALDQDVEITVRPKREREGKISVS